MTGIFKTIKEKLMKRTRDSRRLHRNANQIHNGIMQDGALAQQIANLTIAPPVRDADTVENPVMKPHMFGDQDFEFEFELQPFEKQWPGPFYDKESPFAPGVLHRPKTSRRKSKSSNVTNKKRRPSREVEHNTWQHTKFNGVIEAMHAKQTSQPLATSHLAPSSESHLHLLNLPGEIRNQIYRILCSKGSLNAHFRTVATLKKGRFRHVRGPNAERRFPREPVLAAVCRQLQKEVLSLFYAENKFIFQMSEQREPPDVLKQDADVLKKWSPRPDLGLYMTKMDLCVKASCRCKPIQYITYKLRKLSDGSVNVTSVSNNDQYCACADKSALEHWRDSAQDRAQKNVSLIEEAQQFLSCREEFVVKDTSEAEREGVYQSGRIVCNQCGLFKLIEVE